MDDDTWRAKAQQWHQDEQQLNPDHQWPGDCWCCCLNCDPEQSPPGNPYWREAERTTKS